MCTIKDLDDQFRIQGMFHIKVWDDDRFVYKTLAEGNDFECNNWDIYREILDRKITYMYAVDGVLNIEVE